MVTYFLYSNIQQDNPFQIDFFILYRRDAVPAGPLFLSGFF